MIHRSGVDQHGRILDGNQVMQDLRQLGPAEFAGSAGAVRELREPDATRALFGLRGPEHVSNLRGSCRLHELRFRLICTSLPTRRFRAFRSGFPMGIAAGLPLFVFLRTVWPGLLAAATALFVTFAIFLFVQGRDVRVMREYPGQGALIVLAVSAAGAAVSMFVGFMVGWGVGAVGDTLSSHALIASALQEATAVPGFITVLEVSGGSAQASRSPGCETGRAGKRRIDRLCSRWSGFRIQRGPRWLLVMGLVVNLFSSEVAAQGVAITAVTTTPSCSACRIELEAVRVLDGGVFPEVGEPRAIHRLPDGRILASFNESSGELKVFAASRDTVTTVGRAVRVPASIPRSSSSVPLAATYTFSTSDNGAGPFWTGIYV